MELLMVKHIIHLIQKVLKDHNQDVVFITYKKYRHERKSKKKD